MGPVHMMPEGSRRAQAPPCRVLFKPLHVSCLPAPHCPVQSHEWAQCGRVLRITQTGHGYRKGKKWYLFLQLPQGQCLYCKNFKWERIAFFKFIYLFIFGCVGSSFLCEGFLQLRQAGATLHRSARASHYHGLSCCRAQARRAGLVVVAHGPSCSAACGFYPDQGSNPCPLHWQADSQPLRHQGSPENSFI